jgi:hypothetical protein
MLGAETCCIYIRPVPGQDTLRLKHTSLPSQHYCSHNENQLFSSQINSLRPLQHLQSHIPQPQNLTHHQQRTELSAQIPLPSLHGKPHSTPLFRRNRHDVAICNRRDSKLWHFSCYAVSRRRRCLERSPCCKGEA